MCRLRLVEGLTLGEIAERYGVGSERVRQLVSRHLYRTSGGRPVDAKAISRAAAQIRREKDLARAHAQAPAILAAWDEGQEPARIAERLGLRQRSVIEIIGSRPR